MTLFVHRTDWKEACQQDSKVILTASWTNLQQRTDVRRRPPVLEVGRLVRKEHLCMAGSEWSKRYLCKASIADEAPYLPAENARTLDESNDIYQVADGLLPKVPDFLIRWQVDRS